MDGGVTATQTTRSRIGISLRAALVVSVAGALGLDVGLAAAQTTQRALQIQSLSTRAELVSDGDALIRISTPAGTVPESIAVMLNGRDVTFGFRRSAAANGWVGLLRDLRLGKNEVVAKTKGEPAARLTLINHPVTGPIIAGSHQTPFVCETEAVGFGPPLDSNCSAKTRVDGTIVSARTVADSDALRIAYETGRLNDASRGLSAVPIIDVRPYTDGDDDVHDIVASHITRARLIAANGHADNQVFRTYAPGTPIQAAQRGVLDAMDQWLSSIARDAAPARTALEKVVRNKPGGLVDSCFSASLEPTSDQARCRQLFPVSSNPRLVAGSPLTHDRLKCELKPVDRGDYGMPLSDAQVASVRAVFPQGVCDYSRPGPGQRSPQTWLSFPRAGDAVRLARTER
jgi:hypothetical protein